MAEGKKKIGRNDPCPCGSGKKYKHCCYPDKTRAWKTAGSQESPAFTIKPKETPEPIRTHFVSHDAGRTWEYRPGLMEVQVIGKDTKDIDEKISRVIEPVWRDLSHDVNKDFIKRIRNVEHKLYAVKYHLNNYEEAESNKIEEFRKNYKPPTGAQEIIEEPRLIYEVEAFLFQVKSCLDILSWVLKPVFGFTNCSFDKKGDDLIRQLKNKCPAGFTPYANNIVKLIEDAQDAWVVELIKMRNEITHRSNLEGFRCFTKDPYMGGSTADIHYPTMPNQQRALHYCQDIWQKLLTFCEDFLKFAVEAEKAQRSEA